MKEVQKLNAKKEQAYIIDEYKTQYDMNRIYDKKEDFVAVARKLGLYIISLNRYDKYHRYIRSLPWVSI